MPVRRQARMILRAALCAAVLLSASCRREEQRRPPPQYMGHTMAQWFGSLRSAAGGEESMVELASGGAAAVPFFLDLAERFPDAVNVSLPTEARRFGKESIPAFRAGLDEGTLQRRAIAALCLAHFGDDALDAAPAIADLMVQAAAEGKDHPVEIAGEALRLMGPAADGLLAGAAREEGARKAALRAMAAHSWLAVPPLEGLLSATDRDLAGDASDALALVRSRKFDLDQWSVRARESSRRLAIPHELRAVEVLELEREDRQVFNLDRMSAGEALDHLLGVALDAQDGRTRRRAMTILKGYGPEAAPAVPVATGMLSSPDSFDRIAAAGLLAAVGPKAGEAVPGLMAAFEENLERTRLFAAWALGRIGTPAASSFGIMQRLWENQSGGFIGEEDFLARNHLGAMGMANVDPHRAVDVLVPALDDARWPRRQSALEALVVVGTPALGALERTLREGSPRARAAAALALHHLGEEDVVAWISLAEAADDQDPSVRSLAQEAKRRTAGLQGMF